MIDFLIFMVTMAITPGPNTIISMLNASEKGLRKGISLNLGMLCGITIISLLSYMLLSVLINIIPSVMLLLRLLAIIYLLYLSLHILKSNGINTNRTIGGFKTGLLMQIVNVKVLLLCVSAQTTYIITIDKSQGLKFILVLLIPICCFLCGIVWALAGTIISSFYKKHNKLMNIIFSSSLLLLAIRALFEFFNLLKY